MKKKYLVFVICILVIFGVFLYFINKPYYFVTIDINPSIQINMDKKDKVKRIKALNSDAKEVIEGIKIGANLGDAVNLIVRNSIEKDFIKDNNIVLLMHSSKEVDKDDIEREIAQEFGDYVIEVIEVNNITLADKIYASRNGISAAKAAYISELSDNIGASKDELVEKPIGELKESKDTGFYCESGYELKGSRCLKELEREKAQKGMVCDIEYVLYDGKCYKESRSYETGNYICGNKELKLNGTICENTLTENANPEYKCDKGELMKKGDVNPIGSKDNDKYYCVDKSTGKKPTLRCLTNPGHIMINGKCYNGPAPLINGGCPGADKPIKGGCYSLDDEDQWVCPNGSIYHVSQNSVPELCPDTLTYITPKITGYNCNEGWELNGTKCTKYESEEAIKEMACENGFTLLDGGLCINYKDVKNLKEGYFCNKENSILEKEECIIIDEIDAKHR